MATSTVDETYYLFNHDKTVEVHETWPDNLKPNTWVYQPSDTLNPWCYCANGGYAVSARNYPHIPAWIKAYALLID